MYSHVGVVYVDVNHLHAHSAFLPCLTIRISQPNITSFQPTLTGKYEELKLLEQSSVSAPQLKGAHY